MTTYRARYLRMVPALLTAVLLAACEDPPFQPFEENTAGAFSIFGYLDLYADTQWIRVTPVRDLLLPGPDPIDAVVTLEEVGSGRVLTLQNRRFTFRDVSLDTVAYAHDFFTAEPMRPRATYELRVVRSDGVSSTARVEMPDLIEMSLLHNETAPGVPESGTLNVRGERIPFIDMLYSLRNTCAGENFTHPVEQRAGSGAAPTFRFTISADTVRAPCVGDLRRQELRITTAPASWPYNRLLSASEIAAPGSPTSNVDNGLGFIGGVATWTIPFARCEVLAARPGTTSSCQYAYNAASASISGKVMREPCGTPLTLTAVRLVEEFPGGGSAARVWKTGYDGEYRFEGIQPGSRLTLRVGTGTPVVIAAPGAAERIVVSDIRVVGGC